MENQSHAKEKSQTKDTFMFFVKLGISLDLGFIAIVYLINAPNIPIISTILFIVGVQFILSPILLFIAFGAYFVHLSRLSNIPKNTTLYECINSPTIQYGPIKVIIPIMDEESDDNHIGISDD